MNLPKKQHSSEPSANPDLALQEFLRFLARRVVSKLKTKQCLDDQKQNSR